MNLNSRLRIVKNNSNQDVRVITDPELKMFATYDTTATLIKSYRKGDKFIDGRIVADVNDKSVILRNGDDIASLDYRDIVNLTAPTSVETNGNGKVPEQEEATHAEVHKAGSPSPKGGSHKK